MFVLRLEINVGYIREGLRRQETGDMVNTCCSKFLCSNNFSVFEWVEIGVLQIKQGV